MLIGRVFQGKERTKKEASVFLSIRECRPTSLSATASRIKVGQAQYTAILPCRIRLWPQCMYENTRAASCVRKIKGIWTYGRFGVVRLDERLSKKGNLRLSADYFNAFVQTRDVVWTRTKKERYISSFPYRVGGVYKERLPEFLPAGSLFESRLHL